MVIKKNRLILETSKFFLLRFVLIKIWLVYLQMIMNIVFYPAILNGSNDDR